MSPALEALRNEASDYLDRIRERFKPGVKVTLIVRRPGEPTQDFMLTDDDLQEVSALIDRRSAAVVTPMREAT